MSPRNTASRALSAAAALFVTLGLGSAWQSASAHHGWGGYKTDIDVALTVTELRLGNPHDRLVAVDADGREWNLLLAPPARNRRFGFDESSLDVGDEIDLFGSRHPSRDEIKVHCIFKGGEAVYTYRYNNGKSSLARAGRDERC